MARTQPAESVTNRLRQDVLRGDFEPGTRLIEAQLTERYGTGRDAIRAAILELDKEGLITREANRGATVRELTLEEAISIYEARAALEGLLAQRAAERASEADRDALRALLPEMRQAAHAGDASGFDALGRALHDQVRRCARHAVASGLVETLRNQSRHHPDRLASVPGRAQQSFIEHEAIVEAIARGAGPDARRAVERHIESIITSLRADRDNIIR